MDKGNEVVQQSWRGQAKFMYPEEHQLYEELPHSVGSMEQIEASRRDRVRQQGFQIGDEPSRGGSCAAMVGSGRATGEDVLPKGIEKRSYKPGDQGK